MPRVSDRRYLYQVLEAVIEAGATVGNIPDTVGYAVPAQWGRLIADIRRNVRNIDQAILSVHCHNDLGMAVANSLAAVRAGAQQVGKCTINGIGERPAMPRRGGHGAGRCAATTMAHTDVVTSSCAAPTWSAG